ncbi:MAG: phospholipase [Nitrospinae bacterium RIFCSPLOWO2_12_FULL_47_7]|nr:MAG: phospholipase [Nitrospinae bacterium RIFCSPLOWO2_12_FULL_47_7]
MGINYNNIKWNNKKTIIGETELNVLDPINLLVGFHGADSTPENLLIYANKLQLKNALLVFPEGPIDAGKGLWSWWKDGPRQSETVSAFVEYLSSMLKEAYKHIDLALPGANIRTCLWGFSQGGAASLAYALLGSQSLHKVASICGFLPELSNTNTPTNTPVDILGIYGANDAVVPSFLAEYALEEIKNRGHKVTMKETPQGHEITEGNLHDLGIFFNS